MKRDFFDWAKTYEEVDDLYDTQLFRHVMNAASYFDAAEESMFMAWADQDNYERRVKDSEWYMDSAYRETMEVYNIWFRYKDICRMNGWHAMTLRDIALQAELENLSNGRYYHVFRRIYLWRDSIK